MKKVYIENLLTSYQKEENPIKKYIYIKYLSKPKMVMFFNVNKSKLFNIIKVSFFEFVTNYIEGLKILIEKFCEKSLEIRAVENYHNFFKRHNVYKNFVILLYFSFFGLLYSSICMFLMLLIRSNMPKNVIYGIARKDKLN
ncbi:MAG: hypothetical protein IPH89_12560 [Bacteroidetes bacterium]|nr:hypothetical protein [Bacteroidota bacterium]